MRCATVSPDLFTVFRAVASRIIVFDGNALKNGSCDISVGGFLT